MHELKILAAMAASREHYETVNDYFNTDTLSPFGKETYAAIQAFYEGDPAATALDLELLQGRILRKFADVPKHKQRAEAYLQRLLLLDTSAVNVIHELLEERRDSASRELAEALLSKDHGKAARLVEKYSELLNAESLDTDVDESYSKISIREIDSLFDSSNKIPLAPAELNRRLKGGIRRGHHVLLFARPEVGKSLFALNIAAGAIREGYRVLYVGNEDPIPDLIMRLLSNLTGRTEEEMRESPDESYELAMQRGYDNITFVGMSPGTLAGISALLRKVPVDLLVVDQLRNLKATSENNTQRLDEVARGLRALGRKHGVGVISVTQAGDSAEDKLVLGMGDVDGSNTGIPGATDVMIGIGCDATSRVENLRTLSLPKNKIGAVHDNFVVSINPSLARVRSTSAPAMAGI